MVMAHFERTPLRPCCGLKVNDSACVLCKKPSLNEIKFSVKVVFNSGVKVFQSHACVPSMRITWFVYICNFLCPICHYTDATVKKGQEILRSGDAQS